MIVLPYLEYVPRIGSRFAAHPSSAVIGRTELGADCRLAPLTLVRADGERIGIGAECWFGEASTVHIADRVYPALVGSHVTVGRYALVHACKVGDDCVIGEHAAVMDGSEVGSGSVIAAESVVPPGKTLEGGWLYAGVPARPVERVSSVVLQGLHRAIREDSTTDDGGRLRARARILALRHPPGSGINRFSAEGAYVAPTASLIGRILLAARSSIWFGVEIDARDACITIGEETNIQDNSRLYGGRPGEDIRVGPRVTIGHNVRISSSAIEEGAIIGMGVVIGKGTVVRAGACVAAGSVTEPGTEVAPGYIWSGRPARAARPVSRRNQEEFTRAMQVYVEYAANYLAGIAAIPESSGSK